MAIFDQSTSSSFQKHHICMNIRVFVDGQSFLTIVRCTVVKFISEAVTKLFRSVQKTFQWIFSHIWQTKKAHVLYLFVRFSLFGQKTHFITNFPYFCAFWTFEANLRGVYMIHALKMFLKILFRMYPKAPKSFQKTRIYFNLF